MAQTVYENKSLSYREKKNKIGRLFLFLGFFLSVLITVFVIFIMVISSLGISPNDQNGYRGINKENGSKIATTFIDNKVDIDKGKYSLLFDDNTIYTFEFSANDSTKSLYSSDGKYYFTVQVNLLTYTYEIEGNSSETSSISNYSDALNFVDSQISEFKSKFAYYDSTYYSKIFSFEKKRYFYNEEKKFLKIAINSKEYLIINSNGLIVEGSLNLRSDEDPLIYDFNLEIE